MDTGEKSGEAGSPVRTGNGQKEIPENVAKVKAGQTNSRKRKRRCGRTAVWEDKGEAKR